MNLFFAGRSALVLVAASLLLYGFSPYINSYFGLQSSLLSEPFKLLAVAIALSIVAGFAFPFFRGIRKGDTLIASVKREVNRENQVVLSQDFIPVVALESGRKGSKIKVVFQNGLKGEGIITSYAGTISPPTLKLTETEGTFKA